MTHAPTPRRRKLLQGGAALLLPGFLGPGCAQITKQQRWAEGAPPPWLLRIAPRAIQQVAVVIRAAPSLPDEVSQGSPATLGEAGLPGFDTALAAALAERSVEGITQREGISLSYGLRSNRIALIPAAARPELAQGPAAAAEMVLTSKR